MSSESIAALRKHQGNDLANLAEEHLQDDLRQTDRNALNSAASAISTSATIGSAIGVGLAVFAAFRLRRARTQVYQSIRAAERPTHVTFADGRTEAIPDIAPLTRPTILGDFATYTLFGAGGMFLGGEVGLLTGSFRARGIIGQDPEAKGRIERAWRAFKADALRREADALQKGEGELGL